MCCALLAPAPGIRARRLCCDWRFAAIACIELKATAGHDVRTVIGQMSTLKSPEVIHFECRRNVAQLIPGPNVYSGK